VNLVLSLGPCVVPNVANQRRGRGNGYHERSFTVGMSRSNAHDTIAAGNAIREQIRGRRPRRDAIGIGLVVSRVRVRSRIVVNRGAGGQVKRRLSSQVDRRQRRSGVAQFVPAGNIIRAKSGAGRAAVRQCGEPGLCHEAHAWSRT